MSKCTNKSKQLIVEASYSDLEDFRQGKSEGRNIYTYLKVCINC